MALKLKCSIFDEQIEMRIIGNKAKRHLELTCDIRADKRT